VVLQLLSRALRDLPLRVGVRSGTEGQGDAAEVLPDWSRKVSVSPLTRAAGPGRLEARGVKVRLKRSKPQSWLDSLLRGTDASSQAAERTLLVMWWGCNGRKRMSWPGTGSGRLGSSGLCEGVTCLQFSTASPTGCPTQTHAQTHRARSTSPFPIRSPVKSSCTSTRSSPSPLPSCSCTHARPPWVAAAAAGIAAQCSPQESVKDGRHGPWGGSAMHGSSDPMSSTFRVPAQGGISRRVASGLMAMEGEGLRELLRCSCWPFDGAPLDRLLIVGQPVRNADQAPERPMRGLVTASEQILLV